MRVYVDIQSFRIESAIGDLNVLTLNQFIELLIRSGFSSKRIKIQYYLASIEVDFGTTMFDYIYFHEYDTDIMSVDNFLERYKTRLTSKKFGL